MVGEHAMKAGLTGRAGHLIPEKSPHWRPPGPMLLRRPPKWRRWATRRSRRGPSIPHY